MKEQNRILSVIIPAHNEAGSIRQTVKKIDRELTENHIPFEIIIINDYSSDNTKQVLIELEKDYKEVTHYDNPRSQGYGLAVQEGLKRFTGDYVVICMADDSDDPKDIVKYYRKMEEGYSCVFGSRFMKDSKVINYPKFKLILNRISNIMIMFFFQIRNNDITNAFKAFTRETIEGLHPILSHKFNLTVELPLKAIVRGYRYTTIPISWYGREKGLSKFKIDEMGSRYIFIVLYILLEKFLSKGDYKKKNVDEAEVRS